MGDTTLLRKDSYPPPYAGMTFSHVVALMAPVNIPCSSYAILNQKKENIVMETQSSYRSVEFNYNNSAGLGENICQ